ncbi:VWA domain-containing protein [Fulvimarina sp. 2208YS6-2-32]|uniref:VWA domain-containing protein n=1 Tax=Fulvimarina uroteuthidis TaxID=3098149 RepID=A0ABU5I3W0_9HYPH|nr:VWA domain-containing protein [Fulvimarina sp. 2208YS6-2-32]MDY8110071.1 VWA domain-containing protein [Fulvimarina sp. 2208YS6-2-32]
MLPLPFLAMRLLPGRRAATGALLVPATIGHGFPQNPADAIRLRARRAVPVLLWLSLVVALAGPQRLSTVEALPATGRDLILAIDLSGSMEREDFDLDGRTVTRLDAVKAVAKEFVISRAGDRVGLVLFAEFAYAAAPLTFDVAAVSRIIDEATIGISGRSTAIAGGLGLALKRLRESEASSRVVVLLSDGSDTSGNVLPRDSARLAQQLGVTVHTIALGPEDMETAPKTRDAVDTATLRDIASLSGGQTFRVRNTADLRAVADAIDRLEASGFDQPAATVRRDYWPYPAMLALALSVFLIASRRAM